MRKISGSARYALGVCAALALLAGCGGSQMLETPSGMSPPAMSPNGGNNNHCCNQGHKGGKGNQGNQGQSSRMHPLHGNNNHCCNQGHKGGKGNQGNQGQG